MSLRTILPLLAALGATACGASYQRIYEGDVRFEHCYRLDADPTATRDDRLACWSGWTFAHTVGQNNDRVSYARRRESALRSGDDTPAGPTLITGQPSTVATQQLALTGAPASPARPGVATAGPLPAPTAGPSPSAAVFAVTGGSGGSGSGLSSRQLCAQECGQNFTTCVTRCDGPACAQKCGNQVKLCLDTCL